MPEIKMCEGCCVKMVQFIGTGRKQKLTIVELNMVLIYMQGLETLVDFKCLCGKFPS